ncbi:MAG: glycoside hydrolase family 88 protein [Tannerella sp.]|jgi:rhamnogalacturonyl hydrolase YesR|nr:glycoside hydrolase family 88 protein [Tannerella sp.]
MKKTFVITHFFLTLSCIFSCSTAQINISKENISGQLNKVADRQINNLRYSTEGSAGFLHDHGMDAWTNAVLYIGIADWAKTSGNQSYYEWLLEIGNKNAWKIPENFIEYPQYGLYHADELCIGQFYLEMFDVYRNIEMITSVKKRADWIMNNPPADGMRAGNKQKWSWCDALFMAPPVYVYLASVENDDRYLEFMHKELMDTYNHLYDKESGLFFRDDSFFEKQEANGQKVFWGRGNGWVAAGIARMLKNIPADNTNRPFYENLFAEHIDRLLELRDNNGFWHASLLDPENYPSPETSATALITYAMAYGVNNGLLDKKEYMPHIEKSWQALISVVDENGKLGYVQPIGADPRKVTQDMTAAYGVGALLMAGSEIYQFAK